MDLYLSILKLFLDKETWEKFHEYVDAEFIRKHYPELGKVFNAYEELHRLVEHPTLTDLKAIFYAAYPAADVEVFESIFSKITSIESPSTAISEFLKIQKQRSEATQLAFSALDFVEGRTDSSKMVELAGILTTASDSEVSLDDFKFVSDDIDELYTDAIGNPGLRWRLRSLNRSLGPLRRGDLGFIFARPETGKTTFLADQATYMVGQLSEADGPCLWFNNEEQGDKVSIRTYQGALGVPLERIVQNRARAREQFYEITNRKLRIIDSATIGKRDIERYCRAFKPSLIVIDQLDKVQGFAADREDLKLGACYQWARELAKEYAPVIGVSQADGSGEGVKFLTMGNVANAKTSKQAEADWILGIGYSYEDAPNVRGFSICKNKLIGGDETVAEKRHGKWEVLIRPELGRYEDLAHNA